MTTTVELCGKLADPLGPELVLELDAAGCTAVALLDRVRLAAPALAPLLDGGKVRVCVNEELVRADHVIVPGDLVALFPPVSGG